MNEPGHSTREILESQIARANELYSELESEVKKDIGNSRVSSRTLEITEEILVKLRICLDKGINQYQKLKGQSNNKHLAFPICRDEKDFQNKLNTYGLSNLEKTDSKLFTLLHNAQPFVSKEYAELIELDEQGSKGKHRDLSLQEKEIVGERTTFSNNSGNSVRWVSSASSTVKFNLGPNTEVKILGVPVNPISQLPAYVPSTHSLIKERIISVKFQGKNIDVLLFCSQSIKEVQKIANQVITLSEEEV
jgi:hypothetical protein